MIISYLAGLQVTGFVLFLSLEKAVNMVRFSNFKLFFRLYKVV